MFSNTISKQSPGREDYLQVTNRLTQLGPDTDNHTLSSFM
jgi:hypothetical protein